MQNLLPIFICNLRSVEYYFISSFINLLCFLTKNCYPFQAKLLEASQITQNWMQAAAAAAAAAAVNSPQAATSGPPRTPPTLGGGNPGGSPVGGQGAGACNASNPNMSSKGKFPLLFFTLTPSPR